MRIDPAALETLNYIANENAVVRGVTIPKGTLLGIAIRGTHRLSDQWQRATEFLPERFDISSPLHAKPDGKTRHPLAFSPFSSGPRNCLGQTLANAKIKAILAIIQKRSI